MKPHERAKEILATFEGNTSLVLHKQQIIYRGDIWYHANTQKHVGDTLTRLVKNGKLHRPKTGYYQLGDGSKIVKRNEVDPNQTNIFG